MIGDLIDAVLHLDRTIGVWFNEWGWVAWALVFLVIFVETGVVVFPFLPGDSLLFACGAFAASQNEPVGLFFVLIATAAVLGNTVNYLVGRFFGQLLIQPRSGGRRPWVQPEHLEETHRFFERWGGWAVTLSRFFPIIRTVTPFVAGLGSMGFRRFTFYNLIGGLAWTVIFVFAGFFFGTIPWVKDNFTLVVVGLVVIPALPAGFTIVKTWLQNRPR